MSLPAFALPTSRTWLKIHSWGVVLSIVFTMVLGLNEWIQTLTTRANLEVMWGRQSKQSQSLLQQKVRPNPDAGWGGLLTLLGGRD